MIMKSFKVFEDDTSTRHRSDARGFPGRIALGNITNFGKKSLPWAKQLAAERGAGRKKLSQHNDASVPIEEASKPNLLEAVGAQRSSSPDDDTIIDEGHVSVPDLQGQDSSEVPSTSNPLVPYENVISPEEENEGEDCAPQPASQAANSQESETSNEQNAWWECDFCGQVFDTFDEADIHERGCQNHRSNQRQVPNITSPESNSSYLKKSLSPIMEMDQSRDVSASPGASHDRRSGTLQGQDVEIAIRDMGSDNHLPSLPRFAPRVTSPHHHSKDSADPAQVSSYAQIISPRELRQSSSPPPPVPGRSPGRATPPPHISPLPVAEHVELDLQDVAKHTEPAFSSQSEKQAAPRCPYTLSEKNVSVPGESFDRPRKNHLNVLENLRKTLESIQLPEAPRRDNPTQALSRPKEGSPSPVPAESADFKISATVVYADEVDSAQDKMKHLYPSPRTAHRSAFVESFMMSDDVGARREEEKRDGEQVRMGEQLRKEEAQRDYVLKLQAALMSANQALLETNEKLQAQSKQESTVLERVHVQDRRNALLTCEVQSLEAELRKARADSLASQHKHSSVTHELNSHIRTLSAQLERERQRNNDLNAEVEHNRKTIQELNDSLRTAMLARNKTPQHSPRVSAQQPQQRSSPTQVCQAPLHQQSSPRVSSAPLQQHSPPTHTVQADSGQWWPQQPEMYVSYSTTGQVRQVSSQPYKRTWSAPHVQASAGTLRQNESSPIQPQRLYGSLEGSEWQVIAEQPRARSAQKTVSFTGVESPRQNENELYHRYSVPLQTTPSYTVMGSRLVHVKERGF